MPNQATNDTLIIVKQIKFNSKYLPLWTEKYRYAIISGGRGSGKSFTTGCFLRDLTYEAGHKILNTRYTLTSAKKSVIPEFEEKLMLTKSPYSDKECLYDFSLVDKTYTNLYSKSELQFAGLKTSSGIQTANLKSIEGITTWNMEEAEELPNDANETGSCTFDKIDDSIRKKDVVLRTLLEWNPSNEESFVYERFFKDAGVEITFNGIKDDVLYIYTSYLDNLDNLAQSFIDKAERTKKIRPSKYNHVYLGIPLAFNEHALWRKSTMIEPYRVKEAPAMQRIVVSVDPSVTSTGKQDECGITVQGLGYDKHFYLLEDMSGLYSPKQWARVAIGAYKKWEADRIIAEVNNGGDLVEMTLVNVDNSMRGRIKKVRASKGKKTRAEPISALYEEGLVHHVGEFYETEQELCNYTGASTDESPNRLDALTWGITELSTPIGQYRVIQL